MDVDEFGIPIIPDALNVSQRKREAIVDAAATEFLKEGYTAASVDAIASRAGVSKPTIYKHFGNKERLFLAVIGGILPRTYAQLESCKSTIAQADDLRTALIALMTEWAEILLRPDIMALRRLVIGEIDRFPQLGQAWYRISYRMNNEPLVEAFEILHERGRLAVPDPVLAVQQLVAATIGVPQLVRTFDVGTPVDLEVAITSGVDLFLARYGPAV
ncbi:TetR/AcrR family transcriptional regulator [Nonomuraea typhae]|uniref:TetR/AcrR family transcriptional regulator n=1 Tax=Nonomuraea typhae TaxID=2603600 RepID=UPI0012FC8D83|nr:TetR/AcrR family transcriptional regulator [Nonomuraea typhae]